MVSFRPSKDLGRFQFSISLCELPCQSAFGSGKIKPVAVPTDPGLRQKVQVAITVKHKPFGWIVALWLKDPRSECKDLDLTVYTCDNQLFRVREIRDVLTSFQPGVSNGKIERDIGFDSRSRLRVNRYSRYRFAASQRLALFR